MRCDKIIDLLSPYLDKMTNEKESKCVEEHIASCSKCRNTLQQLRTMRQTMHNLELPEAPDGFVKDLHGRLANEKLKYFGEKHIRTPKRSGWIAAGVAGFALACGIYASSFLPFGTMIAQFQDKADKGQKPSSVAIDNILNHVKNQVAEKTNPAAPPVENNEAVTAAKDDKKPGNGQTVKPSNPSANTLPPGSVVQSAETDVVSTSIKVADLGSSVQKVMAIAGENGGQYTALPASAGLEPFSGGRAKAVSIKVDPENADKVLSQLKDVGMTATPEYGKTDVTNQYNEVLNSINDIQTQISELEASPNEDDKAKLEELNKQLFQYNQKLELLQRTIININLVEAGNQ
jgi:hypothetical protein